LIEYKDKPSFVFTPELVFRGGSIRVTIPYYLIKDLKIKKNDTYQGIFKNPTMI